ncbi:SagB/ThcOx family dehydrogenase [Pseudomonas aeruginosa]|uniref:nitroreductase family protein n=1 Tax=Pseudomonas aeruginosa TaxID=287 RepID=UPI000F831784|nr:nitroreductase family protein [Pseudomonas aeruginosa]MBH8864119.1 nitroreductase family protein [Pseudomonas aeruginosa]RTW11541.1 SagB/ThcOx family dehydrogenase [Pseudomonas aeruginosa]RTX51107.1 SagB/ThcOx family dehydrogenase [Pseudomonas aeruginosa]TEQ15668.1 SagB/ThcOx family dehydrogenase [Pseudomonas aeruginosa]
MTWIDLADPQPRETPEPYAPIEWDVGEICSLPTFSGAPDRPFIEVLDARASHREFGSIDDHQLGSFLWMACRTRGVGASNLGFNLEHRAAPSAGAIHPIHVVVKKPGDDRWWLYESRGHQLHELKHAPDKLADLYHLSLQVLQGDQAIRFLFLAEPGKTLGKYQDGCSLVWRDAGALLGVMALTATALGLNFCPLGITGEPWASALADQGKLAGVGLALLGSAANC